MVKQTLVCCTLLVMVVQLGAQCFTLPSDTNRVQICRGESATLFSPVIADSLTYRWIGFDTTAQITVASEATIELRVASPNCPTQVTHFEVSFRPTPFANISTDAQVCAGDQLVILNTSAQVETGATLELNILDGTGMRILNQIDTLPTGTTAFGIEPPNMDAFQVFLDVSNQNGCTDRSDTLLVQVNPVPSVVISGLAPTYCQNDMPDTIRVFPAGGMLSGSSNLTILNDSTGIINPRTAGNDLSIRYLVTNDQGCTAMEERNFTVFPRPQVSFSGLLTKYCVAPDDLRDTIAFMPAGGNLFGDNIASSTGSFGFLEFSSFGDSLQLTYEVTGEGGCTNSLTRFYSAYPKPTVDLSGLDANYCTNSPVDTLSGTPLGGSFSGTNISSSGILTPATTGEGFEASYSYTDPGTGCSNNVRKNFSVFSPVAVTFSGLEDQYCASDSSFTLKASRIGAFKGGLVTDFSVNDSVALFKPQRSGQDTIVFTHTSPEGCVSSTTQYVQVFGFPPTFSIGRDTFISGNSTIILKANIELNDTLYEFEWSNGQTTPELLINNPGRYSLTVREIGSNCEINDVINVDFVSQLEVLAPVSPYLKVFPNPFVRHLQLENPGSERLQLRLIDSSGRVISRFNLQGKEQRQYPTSGLEPGLYYLAIDQNYLVKLLKL